MIKKRKGNYIHGMVYTRPHRAYWNMRKRCDNPKNKSYPDYGGRGITYCEKWSTFQGFWEDMQEGYADDLTLDRIDVNGNYCKENCRWVSKKVQANNTRANHYVMYQGKKYTIAQLAELLDMNPLLIADRLRHGKSVEEAILPVQKETVIYYNKSIRVADLAKEHGMTYHQLKKR